MTKKFFLLMSLALLCLSTPLLAQENVSVEWGPEQKKDKKTGINAIFGDDAEGYFVLRMKYGGVFSNTKYFIERYNTGHVLQFSKEVNLENNKKKDCKYEDIVHTGSNIVVFLSYYDSKADKNILYAQTYDLEGNTTSSTEELDFVISKSKRNSGDFTIRTSADGSKIMIAHQEAYQKNKSEKFAFRVFTNGLKEMWQKNIELPYKDKEVEISKYEVDNNGVVYALEKVAIELKGTGIFVNDKVYSFKVVTYNDKTDRVDEIPLTLGGARFIHTVTYTLDDNSNKIIVTGFFANKEKELGISGTIYMRIDKKSFKVDYENFAPFDKKFMANFMSEKQAAKGKKQLKTFELKDVIIKDDGSVIMVAEQYYVVVVTNTNSNGSTSTTYYYHYDHIIAVAMNNDGTIKWATKIPKLQVSTNDGGPYSSYMMTYHNNKLHIWYNDNPKNVAAKTKPEKVGKYVMGSPKKAMVTHIMIDEEGKLTRTAFFKSKNDSKTVLKPKINARFKSDQILVYAEYKSKYKLGTFQIK